MCLYSTARRFLTLQRRGLVITITDLEVVVVAAKVGWMRPPTTDLYINLIIKYSVPTVARVLVFRSCILFIRFLPLNMHARLGRASLAESD